MKPAPVRIINWGFAAFLAALSALTSSPAHAEPIESARGLDTEPDQLRLQLPFACRAHDGEIIAAGSYVVVADARRAILTSRGDEVAVLHNLHIAESSSQPTSESDGLNTRIHTGQNKKRVLQVLGQVGGSPFSWSCEEATLGERHSVIALADQPASVPAPQAPDKLADAAMVKRLKSLLSQCSDRARRRGYRLDDGRYEKCVCPLVGRLTYPPNVPFALALDRYTELQVAVGDKGRVTSCQLGTAPQPRREAPEK